MKKDKERVSPIEAQLQALLSQLMQTNDEFARKKLQRQIDGLRQTAEGQADAGRQLARFRSEETDS